MSSEYVSVLDSAEYVAAALYRLAAVVEQKDRRLLRPSKTVTFVCRSVTILTEPTIGGCPDPGHPGPCA
jgi:hypothetical protein